MFNVGEAEPVETGTEQEEPYTVSCTLWISGEIFTDTFLGHHRR